MSLEPTWFSTIFGVYFFATGVVSSYAVLILTTLALRKAGPLEGAVTVEHFHDLGKLMFGFLVFWAYIGFSQFMLIWYAALPEETTDIACLCAVGGTYGAVVFYRMTKFSLVPVGDPRLERSLHFQNA